MSVRRNPPPAPNHPRRASKAQFAQLELPDAKTYEVSIDDLRVGGAMLEFVGLTPPAACVGKPVDVFIDVGCDIEGDRIAGTVRAEIVLLQPSMRGCRPQCLVMWSGCDPQATMVINRLLTQSIANRWNADEQPVSWAA